MEPFKTVTVGSGTQYTIDRSTLISNDGGCTINNNNNMIFYTEDMTPLTADSYKRSGETCISNVATNPPDSFVWKGSNCPTNTLWGVNELGYEDLTFVVQFWTNLGQQYSFY